MEKEFGVKAIYSRRRHDQAGRDRRDDQERPRRRSARSTCWSTMPASSSSRKVEDFPIEKWDAVIAINLSAAFHTTRVAMPGMKARKWGRIINIASAHGLVASGEKAAYVAAKHGIVGLTKVVAIEAANDGITCNAICPGWVLTPLVQQQIEARAKADGKIGRAGEERRCWPRSSRCCSSRRRRASARSRCSSPAMPPPRITGSAYSIDGGWTAQSVTPNSSCHPRRQASRARTRAPQMRP